MQVHDHADGMRVKWKKATNLLASFFFDMAVVRRQVGDERLALWCADNLQLGISVIYRVSGILKDVDAAREREALRRAKEIEQETRKAAREAKKKAAAEQRRLREAARPPPTLPAPLKKSRPGGSPRTNRRQRMVDRVGGAELREAMATGRVSISRAADIAGAPRDLQAALLEAALAKRQPKDLDRSSKGRPN